MQYPARSRHGPAAALIALGLIASYFAAPRLPFWFGWENGPVENTQAALLVAGALMALWCRRLATSAQER